MNKTTLNSQKEKHSTLSLRRATRYAVNQFPVTLISIHALLAESDRHPARHCWRKRSYFYPRSPCGERRSKKFKSCCNLEISIHALLAESDCAGPYTPVPISIFLSTLSLRRATRRSSFSLLSLLNFYPRSPCGERQIHQSRAVSHQTISIHALLAESDQTAYFFLAGGRDFYPRSPCGERPRPQNRKKWHNNFYPRSPCGERPPCPRCSRGTLPISIHALLAESDISK